MNLREIAKKVTTLSELMEGREKIDTSELVKKYPEGVHITACDLIETQDARYCTVTFKEDSTKFYNGGMVLTKIVDAWLQLDTLDGINAALSKDPIKMKFSEKKTKGNNNITIIEVM